MDNNYSNFMDFGTPDDTIAAIATPRGSGAIGIIRVSGPDSTSIVENLLVRDSSSPFPPAPRKMTLAKIIDPSNGASIDRAMIAFFKAPDSYTGEDVIEIFCHGGILITREILSLLISAGARAAQPGEFTCRAFLNGKMDLVQAESVLDVINARNRAFLDAALKQLSGSLSSRIKNVRNNLLSLLSIIEVVIEYPEESSDQVPASDIKPVIDRAVSDLSNLLDRANSSNISNNAVGIVLIGKPNAGKSSLMNRILGYDRVIVSDTPGTTRDFVTDWFSSGGFDFEIMDTAGITNTENIVESEGIKKSFSSVKNSDIILALFDGSAEWNSDDDTVIDAVSEYKNVIPVITKKDLDKLIDTYRISDQFSDTDIICSSTKSGEGLDELLGRIACLAESSAPCSSDSLILNLRHRDLITMAMDSLCKCMENLGSVPDDILSIDIRDAVDALGRITGEDTSSDLLNTIFSNFCVGK